MEKTMAPHSRTLTWKFPWSRGLQSMGSLRVGHDWVSWLTFHFPALEKEMATPSSVLAWRIPGMEEPGGLLSMGLQRVRHDWSNLAAAAVFHWKTIPQISYTSFWWTYISKFLQLQTMLLWTFSMSPHVGVYFGFMSKNKIAILCII